MIKEFPTYTVICDRCGADNATDGEFSGWNDKAFAVDDAMENGFIEQGGKHFCPDCVEWNEDESELVAKAIVADTPQAEGRGVEAESAVPVSGHSPKEEQAPSSSLPDGKWIPVSERYPSDRRAVIVCCPTMKNTYVACWVEQERGGWEWIHFGGVGTYIVQEQVTHWQPLPEHPPTSSTTPA